MAVDSADKFQCPPSEAGRFSLPDLRDHSKEEAFKAGQGFIFYQHLRKAGGTGFCEMAGRQVEGRVGCIVRGFLGFTRGGGAARRFVFGLFT